ncbi:TPA: fimbrial protein [Escherichia coli]|nr:fimbrial protein [Escherichia coli]HBC9613049.1 fimbrial protein [Escherichia coli]HCP7672403.1 fimbrial protein [Escherichia coli]
MRYISCLYILFLLSANLWAIDIPISITGKIAIPPCQINGNEPVNVDFGNIRATDLEINEYIKKISFPISCQYHQGNAYVKVTGPTLNDDDNILATNINGLGIALYQGEGTINHLIIGNGESNHGYKIINALSDKNTEKSAFTFTAKLYKKQGTIVNSGEFNAAALVEIVYM